MAVIGFGGTLIERSRSHASATPIDTVYPRIIVVFKNLAEPAADALGAIRGRGVAYNHTRAVYTHAAVYQPPYARPPKSDHYTPRRVFPSYLSAHRLWGIISRQRAPFRVYVMPAPSRGTVSIPVPGLSINASRVRYGVVEI